MTRRRYPRKVLLDHANAMEERDRKRREEELAQKQSEKQFLRCSSAQMSQLSRALSHHAVGGSAGLLLGGARAFPSLTRSILTDIYLCHACSCHEIEDGNARGRGCSPLDGSQALVARQEGPEGGGATHGAAPARPGAQDPAVSVRRGGCARRLHSLN
jgi:hypothetical protein